MANPAFPSPIDPHFFQPLLPGFHTHLNIPVKFFMKYIEGRNENKTAKLRSDVSHRTWEVKMVGRRFTDGWEEFAIDHDFRIGDFLVFRHEGNMVFHVTGFGPSLCNLQYASSPSEDDIIGNIFGKKKVKRNSRAEAECSSDHSCFVAHVTASNLRADTLYVRKSFAKSNGLNHRCCEIVLVNEHGRSWTLNLRHKRSRNQAEIGRGWRRFCRANGQKAGGFFRFILVGNGTTPTLQLSTTECRINRAQEKYPEGNEMKINPKEHKSKDKRSSGECLKRKKKKLTWRVSSSPRQNRFVTLTLTPYSVEKSILRFPTNFTKANGIQNPRDVILMDKDGVKRPNNLVLYSKKGRMGLGKGWKDFCEANGVKTGESFVLELIWEDTTPMLKFCSKIKIE